MDWWDVLRLALLVLAVIAFAPLLLLERRRAADSKRERETLRRQHVRNFARGIVWLGVTTALVVPAQLLHNDDQLSHRVIAAALLSAAWAFSIVYLYAFFLRHPLLWWDWGEREPA